jgi:hypothetical protein
MSVSPLSTGPSIVEVARQILQRFDANSDGRLNAEEFASLMSRLTGPETATTGTTRTSSTPSTAPVLYSTVAPAHSERRAPLEGFDAAKLANVSHRTPKYIFARVAQGADLGGVRDKAGAEAVLRSLVPDLQAAGLEVLDVRGDRLQVRIEGRETWVDVVRGAHSGNPAFQWLPE